MNHNVIIYGSGGMAKEVYEWSFCNGNTSSIGNVIGYVSDLGVTPSFEAQTGLPFMNLQVAIARYNDLRVLLCIGDQVTRKLISQEIIKLGAKLHTFVHPSAFVAKSAHIGPGSIIYPFVVVSSNSCVGKCCVINSYTGVGHDVKMGDYCTISAQVDLTGFVTLGECVFIGSGARIVPNKKIGAHSKIGAGTTVIRSLGDHSVVLPKPTRTEK